ncbi:hypothetical protein EHS25_002592 [Saitozyma podzolica]|uniref:Uncharacterized protein n=1 Tax=Saitozyma podzolica TaxID=1890683 RepID=A0A427YCS4_9TREE|nr:hypothetical protein EHS25_002592 [Saitozyma podzolica]
MLDAHIESPLKTGSSRQQHILDSAQLRGQVSESRLILSPTVGPGPSPFHSQDEEVLYLRPIESRPPLHPRRIPPFRFFLLWATRLSSQFWELITNGRDPRHRPGQSSPERLRLRVRIVEAQSQSIPASLPVTATVWAT